MLYPKIANIKNNKLIMKSLFLISISICLMVSMINYFLSNKLTWSIIVSVSVVYVWLSVFFVLDKKVNLAAYTFSQMIEISILLFVIDYVFGFKKWCFSIGIPIVIMVSNITMMIITIIKYRRYMKYAFYEILILIFSIVYNIVISIISKQSPILNMITLWVSITNLALVLIFNFDVLKVELQKRFHI